MGDYWQQNRRSGGPPAPNGYYNVEYAGAGIGGSQPPSGYLPPYAQHQFRTQQQPPHHGPHPGGPMGPPGNYGYGYPQHGGPPPPQYAPPNYPPSSRPPPPRGPPSAPSMSLSQTRFNPHAPVFVPSSVAVAAGNYSQQHMQGAPHDNDSYGPPSYANAPMYADNSGFRDSSNFYNPHVVGQQMHSYYDGDAETAAYESMYSTSGNQAQQFMPSYDVHQRILTSPVAQQLQEVLVGLEQMTADPETAFEGFASAIAERMADGIMNDEQRSVAVDLMLEIAMSCDESAPSIGSNNRYEHLPVTIARLFEYLSKEIPSFLVKSALPALQRVHAARGEMDTEKRLLLLNFFSEVYTKIEPSPGSKMEKLGEAVCEQATDLLKPAEVNDSKMKTIILAVKLAGPSLDAAAATRASNDDLLTRLNAFGRGHPQLSESIKTQIAHVVEQREGGWGQRGTSTSSSQSSVVGGQIVGVDGRPLSLSEEERLFLEEAIGGIIDDDQEMFNDMDDFVRTEQKKQSVAMTEKMMEKLKVCEGEESKK